MTYLKMPLQLQSAVAKKLQRCSYQESIAQHIMLLILSHHGEVIGREDFGSMIWDLEFAQPGIAMMILGFLACVCLVAGGANTVTPYKRNAGFWRT